MMEISADMTRICSRCSSEMAVESLECRQCHALIYRQDLEQFSTEAKSLEEKARWREAQERWRAALGLLPQGSVQADWVRKHMVQLDWAAAEASATQPENRVDRLTKKLGPLAPLGVLLSKLKSVLGFLKFKFVFSFTAFLAFYWHSLGPKFGVGIAMLVLAHELGHYVEVKRRGLQADLPVFLPGLGAFVKWKAEGVPTSVRASVSLAGPVAGVVSAIVCGAIWSVNGRPIWAALARTAAWFNAFNLIPIAILDGAGVFLFLGGTGRLLVLTAALALWQFTGETVLLLVACVATWFALIAPESPDQTKGLAVPFTGVLAVLAFILWRVPRPPHLPFR
jgi:Zn-dependent protease